MKTCKPVNGAVQPVVGLILSGLLVACDSGDPPLSLAGNSTPMNEPIVSVLPSLSGDLGQQSFDLLEDSVLRGRFYSPEQQQERPVTIRSLPDNGLLTQQADGLVFVYEPEADFWGTDSFVYQTFSGIEISVTLQVQAVPDPPELSRDIPYVAAQGRRFLHQLEATDADGDSLRFSSSTLPSWLTLDAATGLLSGLPTQGDVGVSPETEITVTDSSGLSDSVQGIVFEVIDVNDAPTLNLSQLPSEMLARESVTARVFPDDADGDSVDLEIEKNAFIDGRASGISVTLTAADVNEVTEVNLVIKATDRQGGVTREIMPVTIYPLTESGNGITLTGVQRGPAVHVVIMGDGYTADQQSMFREHVEQTIDNLYSDPGIVRHMDALSIHMISKVSLDSGADDNDQDDVRDTYFDSVYNCEGTARLICANTLTLLETAIEDYPDYDQVILLVNDRRYGGSGNSGGKTAITSAYYPEIALHEMGHSLANLADEYVLGQLSESAGLLPFTEGSYANVTALTDPLLVPWAHWIDPDLPLPQLDGATGVGLFEGALNRPIGLYRPTFDSRMRSFDAPFGPVNSERWILRLYEETGGGIRGFTPLENRLELAAGESQVFKVSPLFGLDVQVVIWSLDGVSVDGDEDPFQLTLSPPVGQHVVTLEVRDNSGAIRKPPPHPGIFNWTWVLEVQ